MLQRQGIESDSQQFITMFLALAVLKTVYSYMSEVLGTGRDMSGTVPTILFTILGLIKHFAYIGIIIGQLLAFHSIQG